MGAEEKGSSGGPLKAEVIWVQSELMLSPSPSTSGTREEKRKGSVETRRTTPPWRRADASGGTPSSDSPVFLMGKSDLRCMVEGSSFMRSDSCRLKGEVFWLSAGKPRKEPCLAMTSAGACLRGITWGPRAATEGGGDDVGDAALPGWCAAELVPPPEEFPLTLSSASAAGGRNARQGCSFNRARPPTSDPIAEILEFESSTFADLF